MNKITNSLLTVALCSLSVSALAEKAYVIIDWESKKNINELANADLLKAMHDEFSVITKTRQDQILRNGFFSTYSENAKSLIGLKGEVAPEGINDDQDPNYDYLRPRAQDLKLTFPFKGFSQIDAIHSIGHSPSGMVKDGKWDSVTSYFLHDEFGVCKSVIFDMSNSTTKSIYDKKYTKFVVNGNPTVFGVEGSPESGFLYDVTWSGNRFTTILQCANPQSYRVETISKMTEFAKLLDKDLTNSM